MRLRASVRTLIRIRLGVLSTWAQIDAARMYIYDRMALPLFVASLAVLAPAQAETPDAIARRAMAVHRKAFLSRNMDAITESTTPDFTYVNLRGQTAERGPALAGMKQGLTMYKRVDRLDQKLVSARRVKEGVLMVTDTYMEATVETGGKSGRLATALRAESLLVSRGRGWAYRRIRVLKESTTMPGGSMLDVRP